MTTGPQRDAVRPLGEALQESPQITPVPSGVEGLDDLFYLPRRHGKRVVAEPLGGLPRYAVMQVTGVSDTGKSLLVEQFAVAQAARGERCLFVTYENPAPFVAGGLRQRAEAMGVAEGNVEHGIVLVDGVRHEILARDLSALLDTLDYALSVHEAGYLVMDSLTGLFEAREMLARDVVRPLFHFLKERRVTALVVSQKRSGHEALTAEAAGGYAVGHILDGTLVLAKQAVMSYAQARLFRRPMGDLVRLFRIDGCRLAGHDTRTHLMDITPTGLVRIGPALDELAGG